MYENNDNLVYIKVYCHKTGEIIKKSIEEVVKMIVAVQVPIQFNMEVLKVQSIIARTLLVKNARVFGGPGCSKYSNCDICDEGHCVDISDDNYLRELWKDKYEENIKKIERAVKETEDLIITINNKPIDARFHNTCGGSTENSENVLGNEIIYLRKVLCEYCIKSPYWEGYKDYTLKEIEERLRIKFPKLNSSLKSEIRGFIEEIDRDEQGRVTSIKIGGKKFKGTEIMKLLDIDSTRFSVSPVVLRFNTRGKGDGLGLCQYGANEMALRGYRYKDIIEYYYTGVQIRKLDKPCIKKPLGGKIIIIDPGHGGENSKDAVGPTGLREKDVVLHISIKTAELLRELGAEVHLTREKDEYVTLSKRAELGNRIRPNFFISIHLNSFSNPSIHGCEIYHYRNDKDSESLSKSIMKSLVNNLNILDRGVKVADFFLLRELGVSSIQLELDYITNPEQEKKLASKEYIKKIAKAISEGIVDYYRY